MSTNCDNWHTDREIRSQPEVWLTLGDELSEHIENVKRWVSTLSFDEIWFTGAGSSAFIGDIIATELNVQNVIPIRAISSTDLVSAPTLYVKPGITPLVVSFGRSGSSSESIGVLNILDKLIPQAHRLNITCNESSELANRCGGTNDTRVIVLPAHDQGFAMTASFSTMLLTALMIFDQSVENPKSALKQLATYAKQLIPQFDTWANELQTPSRFVALGTGPLTFVARESALKVLELTAGQIPALWDSSLGFRHGPKSFLNDNTHVLLFMSKDPYRTRYDTDLAQELEQQFPNSLITRIGGVNTTDVNIESSLPDHWNSVLYMLSAQILGVQLSKRFNLNVDNPFEGKDTLSRGICGVQLHDDHL